MAVIISWGDWYCVRWKKEAAEECCFDIRGPKCPRPGAKGWGNSRAGMLAKPRFVIVGGDSSCRCPQVRHREGSELPVPAKRFDAVWAHLPETSCGHLCLTCGVSNERTPPPEEATVCRVSHQKCHRGGGGMSEDGGLAPANQSEQGWRGRPPPQSTDAHSVMRFPCLYWPRMDKKDRWGGQERILVYWLVSPSVGLLACFVNDWTLIPFNLFQIPHMKKSSVLKTSGNYFPSFWHLTRPLPITKKKKKTRKTLDISFVALSLSYSAC